MSSKVDTYYKNIRMEKTMPDHAFVTAALLVSLVSVVQTTHADTYTAKDLRIAIPVTAEERNQTLYEMRELLHALFFIDSALSNKDFKAVIAQAKPVGPLLNKFPDSMKARLPEEFVQLGNGLHEAFDNLVRNAQDHQDLALSLRDQSDILTYCSGCHDMYRFEVRTNLSNK
jgi:hypothetical protein